MAFNLIRSNGLRRIVVGLLIVAACLVAYRLRPLSAESAPQKSAEPAAVAVERVGGESNRFRVSSTALKGLGAKSEEVAAAPPAPPLKLVGTLYLDPNNLVHLNSRFGGEIVAIGSKECGSQERETRHPLRFGDSIQKGQLLAVIWSKEVGEQKSALVDALTRSYFDKQTLERLEKLETGVVPLKDVESARKDYQTDVISVEKALRTLRSWRFSEKEIDEVRKEADHLFAEHKQRSAQPASKWAEFEIRSPVDGVLLEKNVTTGDIVTADKDMFKIGKLDRLGVMADAYEEDLEVLHKLPKSDWKWKLQLPADPRGAPMVGVFERIGAIIDPNQHTAAVLGWVENATSKLRVGQFVTVEIALPSKQGETAIPLDAVIETGDDTQVFVDEGNGVVSRRKIEVIRRQGELAVVRAAKDSALNLHEKVLTRGILEIASAVDDLPPAK